MEKSKMEFEQIPAASLVEGDKFANRVNVDRPVLYDVIKIDPPYFLIKNVATGFVFLYDATDRIVYRLKK